MLSLTLKNSSYWHQAFLWLVKDNFRGIICFAQLCLGLTKVHHFLMSEFFIGKKGLQGYRDTDFIIFFTMSRCRDEIVVDSHPWLSISSQQRIWLAAGGWHHLTREFLFCLIRERAEMGEISNFTVGKQTGMALVGQEGLRELKEHACVENKTR